MAEIEFNKITIEQSLNKHKDTFLISLCLIFGLFLGTSVISGEESLSALKNMFDGFLLSRKSSTFLLIFVSSFSYQCLWLLISFLCGTNIFGVPFIYLTLTLKGMGLASLGAYLFAEYKLLGVGFYSLIILPKDIVSCLMMISSSKASLVFSRQLYSSMKTGGYSQRDLKLFANKIYLLIIVAFIAALIDATLTYVFIDLFKF